jgi:hypothetical protein
MNEPSSSPNLPPTYWLEMKPVQLYALPIGPKDCTSPPLFGQAILVDQDGLSEQERAEYETSGISAQPGMHWRFSDAVAHCVWTLYQANLSDIGAWRNSDETWDAYACAFPSPAPTDTIPLDAEEEQGNGKMPSLTKIQQRSVERMTSAARQIETLVPLELKRQSQGRKRELETAYTSLALHAHKLQLQVPALSTFYSPQQYLDHTRFLMGQLPQARAEESSEQQTTAAAILDPAILPQLLPDLLAINTREREKLKCEQRVVAKLNKLFVELDMGKVLQLTEEESHVAYPALETLCDREEARLTNALERLDEQKIELLAMQEHHQGKEN